MTDGPSSLTSRGEFGLPRSARLRRTQDYRRVQRRGRRVRFAQFLLVFLPGAEGSSRVGLTVSRKVGGAVTRNRVKRWLREAVRHERHRLERPVDLVIIAHPKAAEAGADLLRRQVARGFDRVQSGQVPGRRRSGGRSKRHGSSAGARKANP